MKKSFLLFVIIVISLSISAQNPTFKWAKQIGGDYASGKSIATDSKGNVYTTGYFTYTCDFNPNLGSPVNLTVGGTADIFISKHDSIGNLVWAKQMTGSTGGSNTFSEGLCIKLDLLDNLYIAGYFSGQVDFDPSGGIFNMGFSGDYISSGFLSKLDTAGNFVWAKKIQRFGFSNLDVKCYSVDIDPSNNVVLTGSFGGTIDLDPGVATHTVTSNGQSDAFVLKLNASGNFVWGNQLGGVNNDIAYSTDVDALGDIYLTGFFMGTADFDSGFGNYSLSAVGTQDAFLLKISNSGSFIWAKQIPPGTTSYGSSSVKTDGTGNLYMIGRFDGTVDFDPGTGVNNLTSTSYDLYILKLDALGNFIWAKKIDGTCMTQPINCLDVDASGSVYVTGDFCGTIDFDPNAATYNLTGSTWTSHTLFSVKLDPAGNFVWAIKLGDFGDVRGYGISLDAANNVYTTGSFNHTSDFDPALLDTMQMGSLSSGAVAHDVFIHKMSQVCSSPLAPLNTTANQTICINSSANLSAASMGIIQWYITPSGPTVLGTGPSFATTTLTAGSYTYYAEANTCTVSASRAAIILTVDPACQDVWPGDANSDGTADNLDILELGLHYTQTGAPRAITSNVWQSYFSNNWVGTITNGKNVNHSDCNGDGTIDDNDTLAIYNNYGLTHAFKQSNKIVSNPQLSIIPDQANVLKGTWGTASIYLGDVANSINNINGVAYTIDFDKTLIETNNIYVEYQNSFLDAGQNLKFRKLDFANGKIYTATTHTVSNNVSGYGKIATLHYQIKSNLATDDVLNLGISQANQSDASGVIVPLTSGTGTLLAMGTSVGLQELNGNSISISPNPTNGLLCINSKTELQKIEVISITGQVLLSEMPTNVSHTIHLDSFSNGIYFVNVYQSNRIIKREKIVLNK